MKLKLFTLCCFLLSVCFAHGQNISTGIDNLGNALLVGDLDPNWQIVSSPNFPMTDAHVSDPFPGFWEPTPVAVTNAGWLNYSGDPFSSIPGIYTFERSFAIPTGAASLNCNFGVTADDSIVSVELIDPNQVSIPLSYVFTSSYHLSLPVQHSVSNPAAGTWRIRVTVDFIDAAGALLLSGNVETTLSGTPLPCCESNIVRNGDFSDGFHSTNGDGGSFTGCGTAFPASYATDWCGVGTPQYIQYPNSNTFGITLWGIGENFQTGEGIYQAVSIVNGETYRIRFDGVFRDINPTCADSLIFRFWAFGTPPTTVNDPSGVLMGEFIVKNTDWGTFEIPGWTASADYQYLFVTIHNGSLVNDGMYAGWGGIDNICISSDTLVVPSALPCCDSNLVLNADFELGYHSTGGDGGSFSGCNSSFPSSYATNWCGVGTPQYILYPGNRQYGITLWGIGQNFHTGEGIYQNVSIQNGKRYRLRFDGLFRDINPTAPDSIIFKFWAYQNAPTQVNDAGGVLIGEYVVKNTDWGSFLLPDWIATGNFQYLMATIHNGTTINDGMFACWGGIDNVCLKDSGDAIVAVEDDLQGDLFLFPNPAMSELTIRYSQMYGDILTITAIDLIGRKYPLQGIATSNGDVQLNIGGMANGLYFLQIQFVGREEPISMKIEKY